MLMKRSMIRSAQTPEYTKFPRIIKTRLVPVLGIFSLLLSYSADAQLLKRIRDEVKNRAENKVVREAGDATEKAMDKAKDEATGTTRQKDGQEKDPSANDAKAGQGATSSQPAAAGTHDQATAASYRNYDFVPGDRIIFQPDLSSEPDAELPARFTIRRGNAEIQTYEGEKILHLDAGGYTTVTPLMDKDEYLPEQFTLEFDMMWENDRDDYFAYFNDFKVQFYAKDDANFEGYGLYEFVIASNSKTYFAAHQNASSSAVSDNLKKALNTNNIWHHVALYVRNSIGKAYLNEYRVQATNNLPKGAARVALRTDGRYGFKIRNFRLAAGGDDKYNKIVTEGKFVTHGILFDVNKAVIRPESMGVLNEIAGLMKKHEDLNFEIQGHTDSDGADANNLKLSQQRADAVKEKLITMGIDGSRMTTKGLGETKPIDDNGTAEGKANNRRVEFVKM